MKRIFSILFFFSIITMLSAQSSFKERALEQFNAEHYHEAIATLKAALSETPNDAEIYYYLISN